MAHSINTLFFVYDGECPLCQMGASLYKLRPTVGELHIIDARTANHPVMHEINRAGLDVDNGMVIKYQGLLYQGDKALHLMAQLGERADFFNRINNTIFKSKQIAAFCYPFMKAARRIALHLKGIGPLDHSVVKPNSRRTNG